ncbi:hypothetical protein [Eggerthella sinensis]|uniref:hypothetical protein n=1 Tax=Eggerthella sinensis TaxID=242230 RepID=UPI00248DA26E|nr:hypothetical protein [Eggerthella sinensis]
MTLYLSHLSALACIARSADVAPSDALRRATPRIAGPLPPACVASTAALDALFNRSLPRPEKPVHLLVPNAAARTGDARAVCHVRSGSFPRRSFWRLAPDACASGPELCFVQMAETLPQAHLIRLGMELCGTYGVPTVNQVDFDRAHPYTTVERLGRFIDEIGPVPGAKRARRALRSVVDESASPFETALVMLLCLPLSKGGYGLPRPEMNRGMNARWSTVRRAADKRFACDLLWRDAAVAVEYESFQHHSKKGKLADDARRRNDLLAHGITVVPVTTRTVQNLIELDQVAHLLARKLGKRLRPDARSWPERQHRLHGTLLGVPDAPR